MTENEPTPVTVSSPALGRTTRGRFSRGRKSLLWVVGLGGGILVAFLSAVVAIFGWVSGVEFSPTHFETRRFSFLEIPLLQLQISAIRRDRITPDVNNYLATASLVNRPGKPADTWHLVELKRWALAPVDGQAKQFSRCLDYYAPGGATTSSFWKDWSQQHSAAARILWPRVQKLACRGQYALIPGVLRIAARRGASPAELSEELDRHIAEEISLWAADLRAAGFEQLADDWLRPDLPTSVPVGDAGATSGDATDIEPKP